MRVIREIADSKHKMLREGITPGHVRLGSELYAAFLAELQAMVDLPLVRREHAVVAQRHKPAAPIPAEMLKDGKVVWTEKSLLFQMTVTEDKALSLRAFVMEENHDD